MKKKGKSKAKKLVQKTSARERREQYLSLAIDDARTLRELSKEQLRIFSKHRSGIEKMMKIHNEYIDSEKPKNARRVEARVDRMIGRMNTFLSVALDKARAALALSKSKSVKAKKKKPKSKKSVKKANPKSKKARKPKPKKSLVERLLSTEKEEAPKLPRAARRMKGKK